MASAKIGYDRETEGGSALREVYKQGAAFRKALAELDRALAAYADGGADIETDYGVPAGDVQALRDLTQRAAAEMSGVVLTGQAVAQGEKTFTRQLLDNLAY